MEYTVNTMIAYGADIEFLLEEEGIDLEEFYEEEGE